MHFHYPAAAGVFAGEKLHQREAVFVRLVGRNFASFLRAGENGVQLRLRRTGFGECGDAVIGRAASVGGENVHAGAQERAKLRKRIRIAETCDIIGKIALFNRERAIGPPGGIDVRFEC